MLTCNIKALSKSEIRRGFTALGKSEPGNHGSCNSCSSCREFHLGELGMSQRSLPLPFIIVSEILSSSKKRKSQPVERKKRNCH